MYMYMHVHVGCGYGNSSVNVIALCSIPSQTDTYSQLNMHSRLAHVHVHACTCTCTDTSLFIVYIPYLLKVDMKSGGHYSINYPRDSSIKVARAPWNDPMGQPHWVYDYPKGKISFKIKLSYQENLHHFTSQAHCTVVEYYGVHRYGENGQLTYSDLVIEVWVRFDVGLKLITLIANVHPLVLHYALLIEEGGSLHRVRGMEGAGREKEGRREERERERKKERERERERAHLPPSWLFL